MPPLALRYLSPLRTWLPGIPRAPTRLGRDTGAADDTPVLHPQPCTQVFGMPYCLRPGLFRATGPVQCNARQTAQATEDPVLVRFRQALNSR
jgi:hypothetical protein